MCLEIKIKPEKCQKLEWIFGGVMLGQVVTTTSKHVLHLIWKKFERNKHLQI